MTRSVTLLPIALAVISCVSFAAAQTPVGYVVEIHGVWHLNRNPSSVLKRWQKLPAAGTISIDAPTSDDRIVIASLGDKIIDSRRCQVDDCSRPIKLPKANPRGPLRVIFEATMELLWGTPDRYSLNRNRTFGSALSDGIVKMDRGEIDFGPVLSSPGRYYLRWRLRQRVGRVGKWSSPIGLRKELGKPALVAATNFKPGLYEVNLQSLKDGTYETFASAWVMVSTSPAYENSVASFQQALRLTDQWGSEVEPDTARQFLRAHLDYLAEKPAGKK